MGKHFHFSETRATKRSVERTRVFHKQEVKLQGQRRRPVFFGSVLWGGRVLSDSGADEFHRTLSPTGWTRKTLTFHDVISPKRKAAFINTPAHFPAAIRQTVSGCPKGPARVLVRVRFYDWTFQLWIPSNCSRSVPRPSETRYHGERTRTVSISLVRSAKLFLE